MRTSLVAIFVGAAACLFAPDNAARAALIARVECRIAGLSVREPIGGDPATRLDRPSWPDGPAR
jgi:hypothetical protein